MQGDEEEVDDEDDQLRHQVEVLGVAPGEGLAVAAAEDLGRGGWVDSRGGCWGG